MRHRNIPARQDCMAHDDSWGHLAKCETGLRAQFIMQGIGHVCISTRYFIGPATAKYTKF